MIRLLAPAKVNLTLEVLGRRPDGYHELRTVLQTVSLYDELLLSSSDDLHFTCSEARLSGQDNLVVRAAQLLAERAGVRGGATIHLVKRIPAAAGLGGGSSDAATALVGLARLWELDWSIERLQPLAAELGSDVPFFLWGGTALAEGRGERVTPLPPVAGMWFVLLPASDEAGGKTKRIFAALTPVDYSSGEATARLVAQLRGGRADPAAFANDLTAAARRLFPPVNAAFSALAAVGARPHLAGAGPSVFAATTDRAEAERWAEALRARGVTAVVAEAVSNGR
jgi:4-diphosphocytidyl-2-C-methyl-D-erythritol kinase